MRIWSHPKRLHGQMYSVAAHTQQAFSASLHAGHVHICRRAGLPPGPPEPLGHLPIIPQGTGSGPLEEICTPNSFGAKRPPGSPLCLLLLLSEQVQDRAVTPSETRPMKRCSPACETAAQLLLAVLVLLLALRPHLARGRHATSPPTYASTYLCCVQMCDVSVGNFGAAGSVFSLPLNLSPDHTEEWSGTCHTRHSI